MEKKINQLISEIKQEFDNRVNVLTNAEGFDSHTQDRIKNVEVRKNNLIASGEEIKTNFSHNQDLLINYKKRVIELKQEIKELH